MSNDFKKGIIQAHSKTDYAHISEKSFIRSIKQYLIFSLKFKFDLLDKEIDEITLLEILSDSIDKKPFSENQALQLNKTTWKEFNFSKIFRFKRGKRLTRLDQKAGDIAYISSTKIK